MKGCSGNLWRFHGIHGTPWEYAGFIGPNRYGERGAVDRRAFVYFATCENASGFEDSERSNRRWQIRPKCEASRATMQ